MKTETARKNLNRLMFVLSIAGVVMAVYVLQSFLRQAPIICLSGGGCEAVRKSALSYPFGIPVPAFGLVGYAFLVILTFLRTMNPARWILNAITGVAVFGISFVTWFTYTEAFVIRYFCMWCTISAVNMYVLFFLTVRTHVLEHRGAQGGTE